MSERVTQKARVTIMLIVGQLLAVGCPEVDRFKVHLFSSGSGLGAIESLDHNVSVINRHEFLRVNFKTLEQRAEFLKK